MMSCFDRIDLSTLTKECCVLAVQRRIQLARVDDRLACECGQKLIYDGRWRHMQDQASGPGNWPVDCTYSEIVWLGAGWTAHTWANANRTTGLPNSYS